jgi:hypothetical protein
MTEKENLLLADKQVIPDDNLIFSILGDKKNLWERIMTHTQSNYENSTGEWRYYNDGKRWLFKMVQKKKTLFWISILEDTFRVTFWFPDRAEQLIEISDLPSVLKAEFKNAKKYGATRGVSIIMNNTTDVDNVLKLMEIKSKL